MWETLPKLVISPICETINLYWHIKTLMGKVLTDSANTQQEMIIYIVELMDKVDKLKKRVTILANKLANFDFSSSNGDSEPKPRNLMDSPTK